MNTNEVVLNGSDYLQQVTHFLGSLYGLPGYALVCLTCIVVGYALKLWPTFPNAGIPLVCIMWGTLFNPLIAPAPAAGESLRVWLVTNLMVGMVVGFVAWLLHNQVLRRFETSIPVLGPRVAAAADTETKT